MSEIRDRAWRRVNNKRNQHRKMSDFQSKFIKEKAWKMLYTRSDKLKRAVQLGIAYPQLSRVVSLRNALDEIQEP